jgi:signal transduction histidine kinase
VNTNFSGSSFAKTGRLDTYVAITEALSRAGNALAILSALKPIILTTHASYAALLYIETDDQGVPEYAEMMARLSRWGEALPIDPERGGGRFRIADFPSIASALKDYHTPYVIENIFTDPRADENMRRVALQLKYTAICVLPLRTGEDWHGFLSFNYEKAHHFDSETRLLFSHLQPTISAVVARHRAYLAAEAARRETDLLYRISRTVSAVNTYQELLDAVVLNSPLHTYSTSFTLYEGPEYLRLVASCGKHKHHVGALFPLADHRFAPDTVWTVTSLNDANTANIANTANTANIAHLDRRFMGGEDFEACLSLPLRVGNEIIGRFNVLHDSPRQYSREELRIAAGVAEIASVALARIRLYKEREASRRRAELLADINAALSAAEDEDAILAAVGLYADAQQPDEISLTYIDCCGKDDAPQWGTVVAARRGASPACLRSGEARSRYPLSDYALSHVWKTPPGYPVFVEDVRNDPHLSPEQRMTLIGTDSAAFVAMPLYSRGEWQGLITVSWAKPHPFNEEDYAIYPAMANTAAAIVANRRLYLRERDAAERLRQLDRLKDDFISNMSHELRTPLNAVIGLSDVILSDMDGPISDVVRADVQVIFNAGQQLLSIVNDILDLAKIKSGTLALIRTPTNIGELINDVIQTNRYMADKKKLTLRVALHTPLPLLYIDPVRIRQALMNLVNNAIKFTDQGVVEVSATPDKNGVTVCVRDEGIGIAPENHDAIFTHFWQSDDPSHRVKKGVGLGLAITKQLVERHGGQIWLESALGAGAKFFVWLPIALPNGQ